MGYYDALADTNYSYLHLLKEYQFDEKIYFSWRHFLEATHTENWETHKKDFENFDDFISFSILDWAFYVQDPNIEAQSIELASEMPRIDQKLLDYCKSQVECGSIFAILKDHLTVQNLDFIKKSLMQLNQA